MMFIASLIHVRPACEPDCDKSKRIEREFKRVEISHEVIHIFYILSLFLVRFSHFARRLGQSKFTNLSFSITNLHFSITNLNFFLSPPNT